MRDKTLYEELVKILPGLKMNVPLAAHTTFRIGGPAKYFFQAKTTDDLVKAIRAAKKYHLPFFIIGGGSNLLVADEGFKGLMIKIQTTKFKFKGLRLYAEAGVPFSLLVVEAGKRGLAGLEWAGGLPGTLGGAIRGNAGAFGSETKDSVVSVKVLDENLRLKKLSRRQCQFDYRSSNFKKRGVIILSVVMAFQKGDKEKIQTIAREHIEQRQRKGPLEYPNAGSIFKNCNVNAAPQKTVNIFRDTIKKDPFPVIPIAAVIAQAGFKGKKIGGAQISEKHPNFIVNLNNAKAKDVARLVSFVKRKIRKKFGITLQEEVQRVGF